jgi:hypothetical protein
MDSLFNDVRFWVCTAGVIFSALLAKIISSYDKQLDNLFKMERDNKNNYEKDSLRINEEIKEIHSEIENTHSIISGHLQYHQGVINGKKE